MHRGFGDEVGDGALDDVVVRLDEEFWGFFQRRG